MNMVNILLHLTMHEIYMQISSLSASADMMPVFRIRKIKTSLPAFSIPSLFLILECTKPKLENTRSMLALELMAVSSPVM